MTQIGVLLGTAAYMSPEQAKGRPADKRSDVWAFGCVFYEMLTGTRAFAEDDISETLAAILKSEPDWTRIPSDVPHAIRTLIQRCLVKDRRQRVADISAAKFVLCELGNLGDAAGNGESRRRASFALAARAAAACRCGRDCRDRRRGHVDAAANSTRPARCAIHFRSARGSGSDRGRAPVRRDLAGRCAHRVCGQFAAVSPLDRRPGRSSNSGH